jgi:aspartyl-tRNA(Asn)/glutamyl-tRNA(Gln) amidotransferase subunit A
VSGLELLAPTNFVTDNAETAVVANYERTLEALAAAGASIRREAVPALQTMYEALRTHGPLIAAEAYHEMRAYVEGEAMARIDRRVMHRLLQGKAMNAHSLLTLQRTRQRLTAELHAQLGGALLTMPTSPITAPAVEPLEADDDLFHRTNVLALQNTTLGNMLDLCGLALPSGTNQGGMPTSILLSAPHGRDDALLGSGLSVEKVISDIRSRHAVAA